MALAKAKFLAGGKEIPVHFNPSEYSIAVKPYTDSGAGGENESRIGFRGVETLSLKLYFDTYTQYFSLMDPVTLKAPSAYEDVRYYTEEVARLVSRDESKNGLASFMWGPLIFKGVITSIIQKFTMFLDDGKPVRAELDLSMVKNSAMDDVYHGTGNRDLPDLSSQNWKLAVAGIVAGGKLRDILG